MAANLHSRTASRVLLQLAQGGYRNEQDIYRLAMNVDWPRWFDVSNSIKLKTDAIRCHFKSLDFISLKVKDAICDRFRQAQLGRPNVDTRRPDVRVHVFLTEDSATIYLDTSGEPLFKRGWRQETGDAPLRENLAAGILMLTGYNGDQPLLDPMCGSGTFLVEAADIALNRAPGRQRKFAFQKLRGFDSASWEALLLDAQHAENRWPSWRSTAPTATRPSSTSPRTTWNAPASPAWWNCKRWTCWTPAPTAKTASWWPTRPTACAWTNWTNWPNGIRCWATG